MSLELNHNQTKKLTDIKIKLHIYIHTSWPYISGNLRGSQFALLKAENSTLTLSCTINLKKENIQKYFHNHHLDLNIYAINSHIRILLHIAIMMYSHLFTNCKQKCEPQLFSPSIAIYI